MGTKEEINEMFDALERTVEADESSSPATEPPVEDPKNEPVPPQGDESAQTDPPNDAPATEPPPPDPAEELKRENEELRRKLEESLKPKEAPPKTSPPATEPPIADQDFLKDVDVDEVVQDKESFNKLLNNIYKQALKDARLDIKRNSETVLTTVPDRVVQSIEVKESLRKMSETFYERNKDLKPFSKVVGVVFEELAQQNPEKKYNEVLEMVGVETRKRLELKAPDGNSPVEPKPKSSPPPLPRKQGGRVPKPSQETNPLAAEIDAMNKVLGR